jgi:hypothetical protein
MHECDDSTLYEKTEIREISSCSYCHSREAQWGYSCVAVVVVEVQTQVCNCAVEDQDQTA